MNKQGFALRPWFWEKDILKIMPISKARRLGYKRVEDYSSTIKLNLKNHVISEYARSELKDNPDVYSNLSPVLGNYFFLVRILMYQIFLVALPNNPLIQVPLLIIVEGSYLASNVINYTKLKHLKTKRLFFSKLSQSLFLLIFLLMTLMLVFKKGESPSPGY